MDDDDDDDDDETPVDAFEADAPKPEVARRACINLSARTASFTADNSVSVAQEVNDGCLCARIVVDDVVDGASLVVVNVAGRCKCKCEIVTTRRTRLAPRRIVVVNMTSRGFIE
jgi:hypothetical protein